MAPACGLLMFVWQSSPEVSGRDIHIIMVSEAVIAGIMVLVVLGLFIVALIALGYVKKLITLAEELQGKAVPLISKGTDLVDDLGPKIRSITSNVEEISFSARSKVDEIGQTITQLNRTVADISSKTKAQANRVDGIVTDALFTTKQVSETIQQGIRIPVKQVAGIIAGFKAALHTLAERSPLKPTARPTRVEPYDL